jgi:hypothetical protein
MVLQPPIPAKDTTQPLDHTVVITVRGHVYQLDGDTFTGWQVRGLARDITAATDEPIDQVITAVITLYIAALDEQPAEAAA